jgi:hypothetical protein
MNHIKHNHYNGSTAQDLPRIWFGHTEQHDQCGNDANDVPGNPPRLSQIEGEVDCDVDQVPDNQQGWEPQKPLTLILCVHLRLLEFSDRAGSYCSVSEYWSW